MPLSVGDKLGPYEILVPIGAGGMGEVYKARDTRLDRIVAIKQMKGQHSGRFQQEAHAVAALNHPNICILYDVGPNYLVMEYAEGKPPRGPLAAEEAVKLALQIAAALEEAHGKGILHRDLKPGNILVTAKGTAKLLDFGLAKVMKDFDADATKTIEGTVLGTAPYMAPEQAEQLPLDERSEVFSFGAVLYEMLSGNRAFDGNSIAQVLSAVLRNDPPPFDAPVELQRIITKCLAKRPKDRFRSIKELRVALEQVSAKPIDQQRSIAVLPFANMSADKENEYFSDGLAEEILNLLAKIPGLKVIARTSAFAFRGKEQDIRKIAETLGVSNVLDGSVRRAGNRIRVAAQLISAADGAQLWSERYDRDMTDIFAIQDEIGEAISEALKVRLAPRTRVVNVEAYQNCLKGQYYRLRLTPESMAKAKECFEKASTIDPNYAAPHSGLAGYYHSLAVFSTNPIGEIASLAKSAAERALAIDNADGEAHSVLATMSGIVDYDWNMAEMHFRKALAAEPVSAMVRFRYVWYYLLPWGRFHDAVEQCLVGLETDPLSMFLHSGMTASMYGAKQFPETIEYARKALEIDASFYSVWFVMGLAQCRAGCARDAVISFKRGMDLSPWWAEGGWYLAAAYHQAGERELSREWARKLASSHGQTLAAAIYYAAAGEVGEMFEALDGAYKRREPRLPLIPNEPFFEPYCDDPLFKAQLQRMNLA